VSFDRLTDQPVCPKLPGGDIDMTRSHLHQSRAPSTTVRRVCVALAVIMLLVAVGAVVVPVARVARDDPLARCAAADSDRKAFLVAAEWAWIPPGWDCRYSVQSEPGQSR